MFSYLRMSKELDEVLDKFQTLAELKKDANNRNIKDVLDLVDDLETEQDFYYISSRYLFDLLLQEKEKLQEEEDLVEQMKSSIQVAELEREQKVLTSELNFLQDEYANLQSVSESQGETIGLLGDEKRQLENKLGELKEKEKSLAEKINLFEKHLGSGLAKETIPLIDSVKEKATSIDSEIKRMLKEVSGNE